MVAVVLVPQCGFVVELVDFPDSVASSQLLHISPSLQQHRCLLEPRLDPAGSALISTVAAIAAASTARSSSLVVAVAAIITRRSTARASTLIVSIAAVVTITGSGSALVVAVGSIAVTLESLGNR